jgi:7,8-dihydropterin-6-yl-methyl-4-(beta-D-ribofuranosyl)aminobenzene 5'-phosphate synthase
MIKDAKKAKGIDDANLVVDLHPNRPDYRGIMVGPTPYSLQPDPTFEEIRAAGAIVETSSKSHTVLDSMFLVSGEIPRVTPYENGIKNGVRFLGSENKWEKDELIMDERFLMCNVKGKVAHSFEHAIRAEGL